MDPIYDIGRYFFFTAVPRRVIWDIKSRGTIDFRSSNAWLNPLNVPCTQNIQHTKATLHVIKYTSSIYNCMHTRVDSRHCQTPRLISESSHSPMRMAHDGRHSCCIMELRRPRTARSVPRALSPAACVFTCAMPRAQNAYFLASYGAPGSSALSALRMLRAKNSPVPCACSWRSADGSTDAEGA